jgi:hypothetical protein
MERIRRKYRWDQVWSQHRYDVMTIGLMMDLLQSLMRVDHVGRLLPIEYIPYLRNAQHIDARISLTVISLESTQFIGLPSHQSSSQGAIMNILQV